MEWIEFGKVYFDVFYPLFIFLINIPVYLISYVLLLLFFFPFLPVVFLFFLYKKCNRDMAWYHHCNNGTETVRQAKATLSATNSFLNFRQYFPITFFYYPSINVSLSIHIPTAYNKVYFMVFHFGVSKETSFNCFRSSCFVTWQLLCLKFYCCWKKSSLVSKGLINGFGRHLYISDFNFILVSIRFFKVIMTIFVLWKTSLDHVPTLSLLFFT